MPPLGARELAAFVDTELRVEGSCYFHCRRPAAGLRVGEPDHVVTLYHCPAGYVSRVVYYDVDPDVEWFASWLRHRIQPLELHERDVRVATRHPWEYGRPGTTQGGLRPFLLRQVYWTQPRPRSRGDERLYRCVGSPEAEGCGTLFVQSVGDERPLCPACLSLRRW